MAVSVGELFDAHLAFGADPEQVRARVRRAFELAELCSDSEDLTRMVRNADAADIVPGPFPLRVLLDGVEAVPVPADGGRLDAPGCVAQLYHTPEIRLVVLVVRKRRTKWKVPELGEWRDG